VTRPSGRPTGRPHSRQHPRGPRIQLDAGAPLIVLQLFFGHLNGKYVYELQPPKFAAIEARWESQQPGTEVWFAIPDEARRRNLFAIESLKVGSFIATGNWDARVPGLADFPEADSPPVVIPFFAFRAMVGMGLLMLAISWFGNWLRWRGRLETTRWFLWCSFFAWPTGFVAVIAGWFTAEVGRQPWVVWGLLRTADAMTPTLTGPQVLATLIGYVVVCAFATLGASFWPYMIPYSVTVQQAAAPPQSLEFLFWGRASSFFPSSSSTPGSSIGSFAARSARAHSAPLERGTHRPVQVRSHISYLITKRCQATTGSRRSSPGRESERSPCLDETLDSGTELCTFTNWRP
jgi:hypothetical protein